MSKQSDRLTLLFVDDEEEFLASMTRALERRSMEVVCATSGPDALRLLNLFDFDAAVIDVKMPGMDGIELFHRLKVVLPDLPVIMLTGHGTVSQAFEAAREGIFDYLAKPCEVNSLVAKIRAAAAEGPPASRSVQPREADLPGVLRVLLVDDEVELLSSLTPVLSRRGLLVSTVTSGEEALDLLANQVIDVVVLDIKMPGMDGIQALRRIKSDIPDTEVILLTGHPEAENAFEGMRLGAFDYITKPPDIAELTEKIKEAFRKRQERLGERHQVWLRSIMEKYPD